MRRTFIVSGVNVLDSSAAMMAGLMEGCYYQTEGTVGISIESVDWLQVALTALSNQNPGSWRVS